MNLFELFRSIRFPAIRRVTLLKCVMCVMSAMLTLNGYAAGLLKPTQSDLPDLQIQKHNVIVVIEDGYAITTVEQFFHNPNAQDLEAYYTFPLPKKGSLVEFTLWLDGKPIVGEVVEKIQAQKIYTEEKAAGRDSGISEQDSYRNFEFKVYPVRAQNTTRVRLVYIQPVSMDTGIGRYVYPLEEGGVDEQKMAFWTANNRVIGEFNFELKLKSAYPVEAVRMPDHAQARILQHPDGVWNIGLGNTAADAEYGVQGTTSTSTSSVATLDKDLVVYWRHQAGLPGSVDLIANKPESHKRGTFMMVITPGDDLKLIQEGKDWIFILDISGSMQGKYATLVDAVQRSLKKMRPDDRFRIVLFNDESKELTPGFVHATAESINTYGDKIAQVSPNSGTNLYSGLQLGLHSLEADRTSAVILVTDGVANLGETHQRRFIELIKTKDVRLFTAIMGNSANQPLLDGLTKASGGFASNVSNSDDIVGKILEMSTKVTHEAFHGAKISINGIKTSDITPANIGSLYFGQQLIVFGHYWGHGMAEVKLTGRISGQNKQYSSLFSFPDVAVDNPEIERLWAYAHIEQLQQEIDNFGETDDNRQAIVNIATQYSVVTDYTSMVVMRDDVFTQRGIQRHNQKRLAVEQLAQKNRSVSAPVSHRVDQKQPMYNSTRPSYSGGSGGGAIDPWAFFMLLPLLWIVLRSDNKLKDN